MAWQLCARREGVDVLTAASTILHMTRYARSAMDKEGEIIFTWHEHDTMSHYLDGNLADVGRVVYRRDYPDPASIEACIGAWRSIRQRTRSHMDRHDLARSFSSFVDDLYTMHDEFNVHSWFALEGWQADAAEEIEKLSREKGIPKDNLMRSLFRPYRKTHIQRMMEDAGKLSPERFCRRYEYLRSWSAIWYRPYSGNVALKKNAPPKKLDVRIESKVLSMAPHFIFLKDYRDGVRRRFVFIWSWLFDAIAKRCSIERHDLGYLMADEIRALLRGEDVSAIVRYRKGHPIVLHEDGGKVTVCDAAAYTGFVHAGEDAATALNGIVAMGGKARGRVRIVRSADDVPGFPTGAVLVSRTTHPEYLPAMGRACAVVTDEGGLTCHAAIVARELSIPCIVGTKHATETLHDNDLVELDTATGTVKHIG